MYISNSARGVRMPSDYLQTIKKEILTLKEEKNAIILAHNYVLGEVQNIADFCGDSLDLSQKANDIAESVVVFCGVKFMGETVKILSPKKTVLLPVKDAGCPMADMADSETVRELKSQHPNAIVICYVNSTADVKAESDICCTSSNAEKILKSIPTNKEVIFVPDKNLGANTARKVGRKIILWEGFCPTHVRILPEMLERRKQEYPDAVIMVHPECSPEVVYMADVVLSTGGMLKFARESSAKRIIVGTEIGLIHRLTKENPNKIFIPISEQAVCMNMKKINIEDVLTSLQNMQYEIILDDKLIEKARKPIVKMLEGKLS